MRPQSNSTPVCAHCRFLEEDPHSEERSRLRSWCRIWRLLIPDPEHTGCTLFQPRDVPTEKPSKQ